MAELKGRSRFLFILKRGRNLKTSFLFIFHQRPIYDNREFVMLVNNVPYSPEKDAASPEIFRNIL